MKVYIKETSAERAVEIRIHYLVLKYCTKEVADFAVHQMSDCGADTVTVTPV